VVKHHARVPHPWLVEWQRLTDGRIDTRWQLATFGRRFALAEGAPGLRLNGQPTAIVARELSSNLVMLFS
jgi:hypothetical protein